MIVIKGTVVYFDMLDGKQLHLPKAHGIIHDPDGIQLPKCDCYFGPFKLTGKRMELSPKAKAYLGRTYKGQAVQVDVPKNGWNPVGNVVKIWYTRRGNIQPVPFKHPFKKLQPMLLKSKSSFGTYYKLDLPDGCILDDRGFVFP